MGKDWTKNLIFLSMVAINCVNKKASFLAIKLARLAADTE